MAIHLEQLQYLANTNRLGGMCKLLNYFLPPHLLQRLRKGLVLADVGVRHGAARKPHALLKVGHGDAGHCGAGRMVGKERVGSLATLKSDTAGKGKAGLPSPANRRHPGAHIVASKSSSTSVVCCPPHTAALHCCRALQGCPSPLTRVGAQADRLDEDPMQSCYGRKIKQILHQLAHPGRCRPHPSGPGSPACAGCAQCPASRC